MTHGETKAQKGADWPRVTSSRWQKQEDASAAQDRWQRLGGEAWVPLGVRGGLPPSLPCANGAAPGQGLGLTDGILQGEKVQRTRGLCPSPRWQGPARGRWRGRAPPELEAHGPETESLWKRSHPRPSAQWTRAGLSHFPRAPSTPHANQMQMSPQPPPKPRLPFPLAEAQPTGPDTHQHPDPQAHPQHILRPLT